MDACTVDLVVKFAGPVATVLASITAAGVAIAFGLYQAKIARRQANIAQDKLALDLFQRRLDAFSTLRGAIAKIVTSGSSNSVLEQELLEGIDRARWLFGKEVTSYLDELYMHAIDFDACNKELNEAHLSGAQRGDMIAGRR